MLKPVMSAALAVVALAIILMLAAGHPTVVRADSGCGPSTIANTYAFAVSGLADTSFNGTPQTMNNFVPIAAAGTFTFDGKSNVSRSFTVSFGGAVFPVTDSGTYSVTSNCVGSAVFPSAGETWNLVPLSGGKEIKTVIATGGRVVAGTLTRQQEE